MVNFFFFLISKYTEVEFQLFTALLSWGKEIRFYYVDFFSFNEWGENREREEFVLEVYAKFETWI